ncbi:MAG: HAD-IIB family hydrolase [Ruminococcaceae bacterium]|nr:HAD-IIB family hydrolase [Oscillospiraceae bacterium]
MGKFDGWALISDLDGTMIDDDYNIVEGNLEAVRYFEKNGGRLILATGRSVSKTRPFAKAFECSEPCVVYNGAAVYDFNKEEFLWMCTYKKSDVIDYFNDLSERFPNVGIVVHGREKLWLIRETPEALEYVEYEKRPYFRAQYEQTEDEWFKVLLVGDEETTSELYSYAAGNVPSILRATRSGSYFCEFLGEKVNKFFATSHILDMLGISLDKSCGIGDYYNDKELILGTRIGACPASAPEGVRQFSPHVTAACEEGAVSDFVSYIENLLDEGRA